jgi:hypothetical protein
MKNIRVICAAMSMAMITVTASASDNDPRENLFKPEIHVKPSLLHGTQSARVAAALRYDGSLRYDYSPWRGKWAAFAQLRSEGTVASDWRANSENIFVELKGGTAYDFYEPPTVEPPKPAGERSPLDVPPAPRGGYDFGRIEFSPNVKFETDQTFRNHNLAYGCQLGYGNLKQTGTWALVPSVYGEWQRIDVLRSQKMRDLGIDEKNYYRWGIIGSWDWAAGEDLAPSSNIWQPLGLHFDIRYYRAFDLPSGTGHSQLRDALYYGGGINYGLSKKLSWIRSVYVTVAHGKLPPRTRDETMVFFGVVMGTSSLAARNQ